MPGGAGACVEGWDACARRLKTEIARRDGRGTVLAIECYPGVDETALLQHLTRRLNPALVVRSAEAMLSPERIDALVKPYLGGDDPVFGFLCGLTLPEFFDRDRVEYLKQQVGKSQNDGLTLVIGCGARLVANGDILVYADLARWEAQLRFRREESSNLGIENRKLAASLKYKRAFFVDWRVADRWKRPLLSQMDFVLDTNGAVPKLAEGEAVRRGLRHALTRPFRVVPFFDPAPWGGQWMKEVCDLDRSAANYGWCFDCVPEENSLVLNFGGIRLEIPSLNLVFAHPSQLLGEAVHGRFGDEFPIRFDFLDTMGGGNLSFQVHPLTEYIQHHFGMHYTQDESYYLLDAGPNASVYLGLKKDVDAGAMMKELLAAQQGGRSFSADKYSNKWPAKPHDHFLIPAGTVHCSGAESMVLEISATPYIFTFKMWDWDRLGLNGKPRPIHLDHGFANIQWDRTTDWVKQNLINRVEEMTSGDGWREERTGLHEREFIETRRHWFKRETPHHTRGGVNILNLVQGEEALVESPDGAFEPFPVHYAETFIVPASVGPYVIRPLGNSPRADLGTLKAYVRTDSVAGRMSRPAHIKHARGKTPGRKSRSSPKPAGLFQS